MYPSSLCFLELELFVTHSLVLRPYYGNRNHIREDNGAFSLRPREQHLVLCYSQTFGGSLDWLVHWATWVRGHRPATLISVY
jgi:hypothetical protein